MMEQGTIVAKTTLEAAHQAHAASPASLRSSA
jgi:hypothetical protein